MAVDPGAIPAGCACCACTLFAAVILAFMLARLVRVAEAAHTATQGATGPAAETPEQVARSDDEVTKGLWVLTLYSIFAAAVSVMIAIAKIAKIVDP